jgi:hypothetical protein
LGLSRGKVGFRDSDSVFGVEGLGFRIRGLWFMVYGVWFRVEGLGFRVRPPTTPADKESFNLLILACWRVRARYRESERARESDI